MKKYLFGWHVWAIAACAVLLVGWFLFVPREPHGRFAEPSIGCIGMAYYEFKAGTMWLVVPEVSPEAQGTYSKRNGHWELRTPDGDVASIRVSFVAMKLDDRTLWRYYWFSDFLDSVHEKLKELVRS